MRHQSSSSAMATRDEAAQASDLNGLHCQTGLTAHIGGKGTFGAVSNRQWLRGIASDKRILAIDRKVAAEIASAANNGDIVTISKSLGMSSNDLMRACDRLRKAGWLYILPAPKRGLDAFLPLQRKSPGRPAGRHGAER